MRLTITIQDGVDAYVWLEHRRDGLIGVYNIHVPPEWQHRGYGTWLMKMVTDAADMYGWTCRLEPAPFGNEPLSSGQLTEWYARYGFVLTDVISRHGNGFMDRQPKEQRQ